MKFKVKKLLAFLLVVLMALQFNGVTNVAATEQESKYSETTGIEAPKEDAVKENTYTSLNTKGDLTMDELRTVVLDEATVPELLDINEIKDKEHAKRLYEQEEDLNTAVFQNKDGTKTMYMFQDKIKYIDQDGKIKDKSTKITETKELRDGIKYTTADNDVKVNFPENIANGLSIQYNDYNISFTPVISNEQFKSLKNAYKESKKIASDTHEKDRITYDNVFGENAALLYTPTLSGVKEDIVLTEYTGQNSFSFELNTNGLSLCQDKEGSNILVDPLSGKAVYVIGSIISYDSNGKKSEGKLNVKEIKNDYNYILTIVVDEEFLKDKNTSYPVFVDPSITTMGSGASKTIQDNNLYTVPNYGATEKYCLLGKIGTYNGNNVYSRTLMKFPGLYNSALYNSLSEAQITSVDLRLYCSSYGYSGFMYPEILANPYNNEWDESSTCAYDMYAINTSYVSGVIPIPGCYNSLGITHIVKEWKKGTLSASKGIILRSLSEPEEYGQFVSSDCEGYEDEEYKPYLAVSFTSAATSGIVSGGVYRITNCSTNKALDINSSGQLIQKTTNTSSDSQLFKVTYDNGSYLIKPVIQNKELQMNTTTHSTTVPTSITSIQDIHRWHIIPSSSNFKIVSRALISESLSSNGSTSDGSLVISNSNNTNNQNIWTFQQYTGYVLSVEVAEVVLNPIHVTGATVTIYRSGYTNPYKTTTTGSDGKAYFYCIPASYRVAANASKAGYAKGYSSSSIYLTASTNLQVQIINKNHLPDFVKPYSSYTAPHNEGQHYGWRQFGSFQIHKGIDISNYTSWFSNTTKIGSVCNGVVLDRQNTSSTTGVGTYVTVGYNYLGFDRYEYYVKYYHMQNTTIAPYGEIFEKEYIGLTGSTGNSTGPHLHIEISTERPTGDPNVVDPNGFF